MRCETVEVSRDGAKVIINASDFNPETMIKWGFGVVSTPAAAVPAAGAAPVAVPVQRKLI